MRGGRERREEDEGRSESEELESPEQIGRWRWWPITGAYVIVPDRLFLRYLYMRVSVERCVCIVLTVRIEYWNICTS